MSVPRPSGGIAGGASFADRQSSLSDIERRYAGLLGTGLGTMPQTIPVQDCSEDGNTIDADVLYFSSLKGITAPVDVVRLVAHPSIGRATIAIYTAELATNGKIRLRQKMIVSGVSTSGNVSMTPPKPLRLSPAERYVVGYSQDTATGAVDGTVGALLPDVTTIPQVMALKSAAVLAFPDEIADVRQAVSSGVYARTRQVVWVAAMPSEEHFAESVTWLF